MSVLVDGRPAGLDAYFRPGNTFTLTLTWPAGSLVGRTFTAALDVASLSLSVVGDVMTVTASEAQTTAAATTGVFLLTETTGGVTQDVIGGTWSSSTRPGTPTSLAVNVTTGAATVQVSFPGVPQAVGGGFTIGGDVNIAGQIKTGVLNTTPPKFGATFGGIEREQRIFPAGEMMSPSAVINFGDGFPRLNLPPGITTDVYMIFEVEEWWLASTIGIYFEWVNDHSTTGNVRWDCDVKQSNIGTIVASEAITLSSRTFTAGSPGANQSTTSIVGSILNGNPVNLSNPGPGPFASFYRVRISRLGADGADTLAGPVGLVASNMTRGQ